MRRDKAWVRSRVPLYCASLTFALLILWTLLVHQKREEYWQSHTVTLQSDSQSKSVAETCIDQILKSHVLLSEWTSQQHSSNDMQFSEFYAQLPYSHDFILDARTRNSISSVVRVPEVKKNLEEMHRLHQDFRTEVNEIKVVAENESKAAIAFEERQLVDQIPRARIYSLAYCQRRASADDRSGKLFLREEPRVEIYLLQESDEPLSDDSVVEEMSETNVDKAKESITD